jgi:AAHS family benzoate transporter-like MFS transporter
MSADLTHVARRAGVASRRAIIGLLLLTTAISVADGYDLTVFATVLPLLLKQHEWGITAVSAGNVASLQMLGLLVGALLSGYLGDRIGRRRMVIGNLVIFSVFTGLVAVAPNLELVAALRFLGGLGLGGIVPVMIALVAEYSPENRRYLNNTIMLAGTGVGAFLAPLSGALVLSYVNFRWLFAAGGFVTFLVLTPLALRYLPESTHFLQTRRQGEIEDSAQAKTRIRSLFTRQFAARTVLILVAQFFVFSITFGLLTTWLPQYLVLSGFQITSALVFSTVSNLALVIGGVAGGLLQDRVGAKPVVIGYSLLGSVGLVALGFVLHAPVAIYLVVFVLGFTSMLFIMNGLVANSYPAHARGTVVGLAFAVGRVGSIVATAAGGWLIAARLEPQWNFWAWILPMLVPAIALAFVRNARPADEG